MALSSFSEEEIRQNCPKYGKILSFKQAGDLIMFDYPEYKKTTDAEKFIYGFKQLVKDTNLCKCESCFQYVSELMFKDGSSVDMRTLLNSVGFSI